MKKSIKRFALAMTMLTLFFVVTVSPKDISPATQGSTFWGCWSFFSAGPCRAVYRDSEGNYTICGQCDSSGTPGPGGCSAISEQTLEIGYWCS
jgi:hypothetical protein